MYRTLGPRPAPYAAEGGLPGTVPGALVVTASSAPSSAPAPAPAPAHSSGLGTLTVTLIPHPDIVSPAQGSYRREPKINPGVDGLFTAKQGRE